MLFNRIDKLVNLATEQKVRISDIMIQQELAENTLDQELIYQQMAKHLQIMKQAAHKGLTENLQSNSGLIGGDGKKLSLYNQSEKTLAGKLILKASSIAIATTEVNACMGAIVASPTAGSCGVVPGCLLAAGEQLNSTDDDLIHALFAAGAIGMVIANNASISGAAGGCQAEIGSATAMAAGALVQLVGGTPQQSAHATAMALKSLLGLVCDPVAGLVEVPCIKRNATGTAIAILSADMALAGIKSAIPCDEVIDAMYRVGCSIPHTLRETALGGLATTETGQAIRCKIFGK